MEHSERREAGEIRDGEEVGWDEGKVLHNLPVAPWKVNYRLRLPVFGAGAGVKSGLSSRVGSANKPRNPHPIQAPKATATVHEGRAGNRR